MNLFSSDVDWAPEEVIEDTISLFNNFNVKCTFFCTHQSAVLNSISQSPDFELGIHPNFLPLLNGEKTSIEEVIQRILKVVPSAKGVRSHSLVQSTPLTEKFKEFGLEYESNTLLPYWNRIRPIKLWNGIIRLPINFEDDVHFMYRKGFQDCGLNHKGGGLNIFSFHPIHIFLNTDSVATYNLARKHYQDSKELIKYRNKTVYGTRDLLIDLLKGDRANFNESFTFSEYIDNHYFKSNENSKH